MSRPGASRLVLIGLAALLMAAAVYVVGSSIQAGQREAWLLPVRAEPTPRFPSRLEYSGERPGRSTTRPCPRLLPRSGPWPCTTRGAPSPALLRDPASHRGHGRPRREMPGLSRRRRLGAPPRRLHAGGPAPGAHELSPVPHAAGEPRSVPGDHVGARGTPGSESGRAARKPSAHPPRARDAGELPGVPRRTRGRRGDPHHASRAGELPAMPRPRRGAPGGVRAARRRRRRVTARRSWSCWRSSCSWPGVARTKSTPP